MSHPVLDAIHARRSIRAYAKTPVTREEMETILSAGQAAPSARNLQPYHFTAVMDGALIARVNEAARQYLLETCEEDARPPYEDPTYSVFHHAPAAIFLSTPGTASFRYTEADMGMAIQNMALAAHALGLGSVILGMPRAAFVGEGADALRQALAFPEGYDFFLALALGHAAATKDPHPILPDRVTTIG